MNGLSGGHFLGYLPSPPTSGLGIGPLRLHVYGLLIACGIAAAVWLAQRRWQALGGEPGTFARLGVWAVPAGLIGVRLYSVVTSWQVDTGGHWYKAFEIWDGGLGIWGGVAVGVAAGLITARRYHLDWKAALDCAAPALDLAQAIGRFGITSTRSFTAGPAGSRGRSRSTIPVPGHLYPPGTTFQTTFLYESLWDLACVALLIYAKRRVPIRRGYLFALYASLYCLGRFFIEYIRIDEAHRYLGLRLNDWASIAVFLAGVAVLAGGGIARPGHHPETTHSQTGIGPREPARIARRKTVMCGPSVTSASD